MRISIFGLGYVGAVCAGCLSARGHEVIGVDVSSTKIDLINQGKSPIVEPGLEALLQQGRQTGRHHRFQEGRAGLRRIVHLRRHAEQEERRPGPGLHRDRLPRDRLRHPREVRTPHRGGAQHRTAGHRQQRGDPADRGLLGQEGRGRLRRRHQPRIPPREHRDQGLRLPADDRDRRTGQADRRPRSPSPTRSATSPRRSASTAAR